MAEFLAAYLKTHKNEGGYANVKGDTGGETYCGISRKHHPNWEGWVTVDAYKPLKHGEIIKCPILAGKVKAFYKREFWDRMKGDQINDQGSAERIYDTSVHSGLYRGIAIAQRTAGLAETGKMDSVTLSTLNA